MYNPFPSAQELTYASYLSGILEAKKLIPNDRLLSWKTGQVFGVYLLVRGLGVHQV